MSLPPIYREVEHARFIYPYYADEWGAIAFVKQTFETHALPLNNPLVGAPSPFFNFEFIFHSFIAELFLLLNLDPLSGYVYFGLCLGIILCLLVYVWLTKAGVGRFAAWAGSLFVLYITQGSNMPGIWSFIPFSMGLVVFLMMLYFVLINETDLALASGLLCLLFYPPLFLFVIVSLFVSMKREEGSLKKQWPFYFLGIFLVAVMIAFAYLRSHSSLTDFFKFILFQKVFYQSYTPHAIPSLPLWYILPLPVIILFLIGLLVEAKKYDWLIAIFNVGIFYWVFYALVPFRFIIEYQRVVVLTTVLLCIFAGFGLDFILGYLERNKSNNFRILKISLMGVIIVSLGMGAIYYTQINPWRKLVLQDLKSNASFVPSAPATEYLKTDDLRVLGHIKNRTFLSLPWKSLVVAVATGNFPLSTKAGVIGTDELSYHEFIKSSCEQKTRLADRYRIEYVYSMPFQCSDFILVDQSREGLRLYKYYLAHGLLY